MQNNNISTTKTYPCPQCQKPTIWDNNDNKPFCSKRCKLIDLGAWANEDYRVPAHNDPFTNELE